MRNLLTDVNGVRVGYADDHRLGSGAVSLSDAGASISFQAGKWVVTVRGPLDVAHLRAFSGALRLRASG